MKNTMIIAKNIYNRIALVDFIKMTDKHASGLQIKGKHWKRGFY